MSRQEHLELGDNRIIGRNLFVRRLFEYRTRNRHIGVFLKDVVQEREVKEGKNSQGIMFLRLLRRMKELSEPRIIVNVVKGTLFIGRLEVFKMERESGKKRFWNLFDYGFNFLRCL